MKCPECGMEIGKKAGIDIYKHAVSCFHLNDQGIERILQELADDQSERAKRIKTLMLAAQKGE